MLSGWCLAVGKVITFCINHMTVENGLRVRLYPSRKPISYGRDIFLKTR